MGLFGVTRGATAEFSRRAEYFQRGRADRARILFLLGYLAAQMRVRFRSPFWRTIGWRPLEMDGASAALVYGALVFGGILSAALVTAVELRVSSKAAIAHSDCA